MGVFRQTKVAFTSPEILVILERSARVEATEAGSIPSVIDMADAARSCRTRVANWLGAGAEHPAVGGGGGLLLGADHPSGAIP